MGYGAGGYGAGGYGLEPVVGTGATAQAAQVSSGSLVVSESQQLGGGYWAHFGQRHWSAPKLELAPSTVITLPQSVSLPQISGTAQSVQAAQFSAGTVDLFLLASGRSKQRRQCSKGIAMQSLLGSGYSRQPVAYSTGQAATIDRELELFVAGMLALEVA